MKYNGKTAREWYEAAWTEMKRAELAEAGADQLALNLQFAIQELGFMVGAVQDHFRNDPVDSTTLVSNLRQAERALVKLRAPDQCFHTHRRPMRGEDPSDWCIDCRRYVD